MAVDTPALPLPRVEIPASEQQDAATTAQPRSSFWQQQLSALRRRAIDMTPSVRAEAYDKHAKAALLLKDLTPNQRQFVLSHRQVIKNVLDGTVPLTSNREYQDVAAHAGLSYSDFIDLIGFVDKYHSLKQYLFTSDYNQNQLMLALNRMKR